MPPWWWNKLTSWNLRMQASFRRDYADDIASGARMPVWTYVDADGKRNIRWGTFLALMLIMWFALSIDLTFFLNMVAGVINERAKFLSDLHACATNRRVGAIGSALIFNGSVVVCSPGRWTGLSLLNDTRLYGRRPGVNRLLADWQPGTVVLRAVEDIDLHHRCIESSGQCTVPRDDLYVYSDGPANATALHAFAGNPRLLFAVSATDVHAMMWFVRPDTDMIPAANPVATVFGWDVFVTSSTLDGADTALVDAVMDEIGADIRWSAPMR